MPHISSAIRAVKMKNLVVVLVTLTLVTVITAGNNAESIPGTSLKTRTPYQISTKSAGPEGVVSWTSKTGELDDYHYVQIDNNGDNRKYYYQDGKWLPDAQWEFIPVQTGPNSQWYRMVNQGRPNDALTWSQIEFVEGPEHQTNYLVLDANQKGLRADHDFLVKPVPAKGVAGNYYQLKLKGFPKGVVTFSTKVYGGKDQRYIMVDNSRDKNRMDRYAPDGDWYKFTLFSLVLAA